MRVLVAMSGGVDSSLAAALTLDAGHEVVGATMKLWGGPSDSGCCSVADVTDARRVCDELGIEHHVFNFTEDFESHVVGPYVAAHAAGRTPNPCVECNRHLKFDRFLVRARRLGFDAVATGHHARVERGSSGAAVLRRGRDRAKDQSYVLAVLTKVELGVLILPVGDFTKAEVRAAAAARGLRTAAKPDSQDVCFISSRTPGEGRAQFLAGRAALHRGEIVDGRTGEHLGEAPAVELVTVGQRRGLHLAGGERRYALHVDVPARRVTVGSADDLLTEGIALAERTWVDGPLREGAEVTVQVSAHGAPRPAVLSREGVTFLTPARRVAPGQLVALYLGDAVVGSGTAT